MFKKSNYTVLIEKIDDKYLMYNTLSGAFSTFNKEIYEIYNNIENLDIKILSDEYNETISNLNKYNFIVNKNLDEYKLINVLAQKEKYNSKYLLLTIAPTMNCNMNCPYCYEKKETGIMSDTIMNSIENFVEDQFIARKYLGLEVTWYGGEPLMAKEIILKLSKKLIDISNKYNVKYNSKIITNGMLLSKEFAEALRNDCNVSSAQITLDGSEKTNNLRRLLKNNDNSFNKIINGIRIAAKANINVSVRVNIDKTNVNEIDEIIKIIKSYNLLDNNNIHLYFAPVVASTEKCNTFSHTCYSMDEFSEIDFKIIENMYNNNVKPQYPSNRCISCSAICDNTFVIDPKGYIYRCWDDIEDINRTVGNVTEGVKVNNVFLEWLSLDHDEKCKSCIKLPICQGGCPYLRIKNKETVCHYKAKNFKKTLSLLYKDYKKVNKIDD